MTSGAVVTASIEGPECHEFLVLYRHYPFFPKSHTMKMLFPALGLMLVVMLAFTQCTAPEAAPAEPEIDMAALTAEIQAMEDAWAAGEMAGDADAIMNYYADEVVSYPSEEEPVHGKEALRAKIAEDIAQTPEGNTVEFKVVDVFADGDLAVEIGSWTNKNADGEVTSTGHYMSVMEKRDGNYVCIREMAVSSSDDDDDDDDDESEVNE